MLSDDQIGQHGDTLATGAGSPGLDSVSSADPATTTPAAAAEPGYLLFRCAGVDCAVPLVALREVLPRSPAALPLPHSPEWLLGVFALRAELVGLADPAPLLFGAASDRSAPRAYGAALLAGDGERVLAWAVESIGATAPFAGAARPETGGSQPGASMTVTPDPDGVSRTLATPGQIVASAYAMGEIAAAGQRYAVIHVEALLADMLRALEERPADV